ncbi:MAG: hypothetical protein GY805_10500, partial [Chloroflexi bacterium]|nr:hypothetical protein [Chloroflexota bacterium]
LLQQRAAHPAFDPNGEQQVIHCHPSVFTLLRTTKDDSFPILCLHNVAHHDSELTIDLSNMPFHENGRFSDLLTKQHYPINSNQLVLKLAPYQVLWLTEHPPEK